jgi:hypothetical protein
VLCRESGTVNQSLGKGPVVVAFRSNSAWTLAAAEGLLHIDTVTTMLNTHAVLYFMALLPPAAR